MLCDGALCLTCREYTLDVYRMTSVVTEVNTAVTSHSILHMHMNGLPYTYA